MSTISFCMEVLLLSTTFNKASFALLLVLPSSSSANIGAILGSSIGTLGVSPVGFTVAAIAFKAAFISSSPCSNTCAGIPLG